MTIEVYLLLALTQTVLSAAVAILSFVKFRLRSQSVRLIGFIFLASCLANVISWLMTKSPITRGYVNATYTIYLMISLPFYSTIYFKILHGKNLTWFGIATGSFLIFALINLFFVQKTEANSYSYLFHSAIIIVFSLSYFYVLIQDLPSLHVHQLPMFWFNSALLVFHAGTFFLFSFYSYLVHVLKNNMLIYWSFHNMLSIIEHFIFLVGLYYSLKMLRSKEPVLHTEV